MIKVKYLKDFYALCRNRGMLYKRNHPVNIMAEMKTNHQPTWITLPVYV